MTTAIEWTDETWNPSTGCDRVSPGCDHCYALTLAGRLKAMGQPKYQLDGDERTSGPGFGLTAHHDTLDIPLRWRKRRRVFVNSMSDLFHEAIPMTFQARVFATMAKAPQHTFQVLTKRAQRMARLLGDWAPQFQEQMRVFGDADDFTWPLPNVWLGVSIENDRYTFRADHLRQTPAAVRFISYEPALGPVPSLDLTGIDWLICGGESGPHHRPLDLEWARNIRDRCVDANVRYFFKQVGGRTPKAEGRELDGRTWDEMP